MSDAFDHYADQVSAPARRIAPVQPSDTVDLADVPKGLYVGTGGDVALVAVDAPAGAAAAVFRNVPSGALLPVRARRVMATGTSAGDMLGLL